MTICIDKQKIPSRKDQCELIKDLIIKQLSPGDSWYIIDIKWIRTFKQFVNWDYNEGANDSSHPGPIDNSTLLEENGELKQQLQDELHYILVPEEAWRHLFSWYGLASNQTALERKVIELGRYTKYARVEVYPVDIKVSKFGSGSSELRLRKYSKTATIDEIEKDLRNFYTIPNGRECRLWFKEPQGTSSFELMSKSTLEYEGVYSMIIMIEPRGDDGKWHRPLRSSSISAAYSPSVSDTVSKHYTPGLCGLANVGNTCFMNSALQCMSNTPPLTEYFLSEYYLKEINSTNPLGMKGEIARSYGELIHQMWSGRHSSLIPRMFKTQVGRFAPQFSGYQQQDAQELLAFLLDGLHEDLNRIQKKPYIQIKEADGRPDAEVATEALNNHRLRNDSIIVDMFHGLFKSTLVCPECSKVSVTFDPYCFLSLPLPVKKKKSVNVILIKLDPSAIPMKYKVHVEKSATAEAILQALHELCTELPVERMRMVEVYASRFHKVFQSHTQISDICDRDEIYVHEIAPPSNSNLISVPVLFREARSQITNTGFFSTPVYVVLPVRELCYQELYDYILKRISRVIKESPTTSTDGPHKENGDLVNGLSNDGSGEEDMDDFDEKGAKRKFDPPFIFSITVFAGSVSADAHPLQPGVKFTPNKNTMLALDFTYESKLQNFLRPESDKCTNHASVHQSFERKKPINLDDCIDMFLSKEQLGPNDPWYCPQCKKHQQASKKFDLWTLPHILVIHLKRFSYNRYWRDKLDVLVDFPLTELEFSRFVINPCIGHQVYNLIGVVNHYGGLGGGHYTAYAQQMETKKWHLFDDSSVSPADARSVVSSSAYVLFYERQERLMPASFIPTPEQDMGDFDANGSEADQLFTEDMELERS